MCEFCDNEIELVKCIECGLIQVEYDMPQVYSGFVDKH